MTRVVISQPMYFPWVGFMAQMALADIFIWLDDAQFSRGSFTNRVQAKVRTGRKWLTIPVMKESHFQTIKAMEAANPDWPTSHRATLTQSFKGRPYAKRTLELFDAANQPASLCDRLIASAELQAKQLNILPPVICRSSAMNCVGHSWERVLKLVRAVEGKEYVTGHGAFSYLNHAAFNSSDVSVSYMDYDPVPWPQPFGEFTPFVTALDLIASVGPEQARNHLRPQTMDWRVFQARRESES